MKHAAGMIHSTLPGLSWPGLPGGAGDTLLAVLDQLDRTQWWTPRQLRDHQFAQAGHSLAHAFQNVPFYRQRLAAAGYEPGRPLTAALFDRLPLMTRADLYTHGAALRSGTVPAAHGRETTGETSGSTGMPVRFYGTELTDFFWRTYTVRDHLWHRRDLSGKLAAIRKNMDNAVLPGWGPSTDQAFQTGPCATLSIGVDIDGQLDWLRNQEPDYLITNAYNLYWLARRSLERGLAVPRLREARTFGGTFPEDTRDVVGQAWNVRLVDVYTAEEVGYIALQCPDHEHYHAQSESLIVEILDATGNPCGPGEIGRVVITTLHNFSMPLVRYEIGDYAEAGQPCPCGRGLPVISRILGRSRNILTLPDGARRWPSFPSEKWSGVAPVRQLQLIQKSPANIELRVVAERKLSGDEENNLIAALQSCLGYPFMMEVRQLAEIPRAVSHKFEDFISEVA